MSQKKSVPAVETFTTADLLKQEEFLKERNKELRERLKKEGINFPDKITQERLVRYLSLSQQFKELKEKFEQEEQDLLDAVELGVPVEDGVFAAMTEIKMSRRPSWKKHYIEVMGEDAAEEVSKNTEPSFSVGLDVRVKANIRSGKEDLFKGYVSTKSR